MQKAVLISLLVLSAKTLSGLTDQEGSQLLKRLHDAPLALEWRTPELELPLQGTPLTPLVRIFLNGSGPYLFLLDTGSDLLLVQESVAGKAGLKVYRNTGKPSVCHIDKLALGGLLMNDLVAGVRSWDGEVDGVLGFNLFRDILLTVDFPRMRLYLGKPGPKKTTEPNTLKFSWAEEKTPHIPIAFGRKKIDVELSTGLSEYFRIPEDGTGHFQVKFPPMPARSTQGFHVPEGLGMARITDNLFLGTHIVLEPILTIGDTDQFMIGCGILRYFSLTFNTRDMTVTFGRTSDIPIVVPSLRELGFRPDADERGWYVKEVFPWLSELNMGISAGDRIIMAESRSTTGMTRYEWNELERLKNYITLVLERDGREIQLELPVRIILP